MSRLRLRVAQRLKAAQNTYALLTTFNEVDMSNIIEMRTLYKDLFLQKHGVKLGRHWHMVMEGRPFRPNCGLLFQDSCQRLSRHLSRL